MHIAKIGNQGLNPDKNNNGETLFHYALYCHQYNYSLDTTFEYEEKAK